MRGKYKLVIDRLEVCYTATRETASSLVDTLYFEGDGYRLQAMEGTGTSSKETDLAIEIQEPQADGSTEWARYGTLRIGSTFEEEDSELRYVWVKLENRALYTQIAPDYSSIAYLDFIASSLNLTYNNITKLDLAVDTTINYFARIKRAVRTPELTPVVLGRAFPLQDQIIERLLYIHTGDRKRYRTSTISISTKEKDLSLCVYNKGEEIKESGKDYITDWDGMGETIYRLEVRLKRTSLKDYLEKSSSTFEELYQRIQDRGTLLDMFFFYLDKVLRFKDGRKTISVLEL